MLPDMGGGYSGETHCERDIAYPDTLSSHLLSIAANYTASFQIFFHPFKGGSYAVKTR